MGRAHSNAWGQVNRFFKLPTVPARYAVFGTPEAGLSDWAEKWGWQHCSTRWQSLVKSPDVDLVDVATPNYMHAPVVKAALAAGKHVACEKPLARTLSEAREMVQAARKSVGRTFVWFCYRRCPAVAMAFNLIRSGKIGHVRHVRAFYLQDWADEAFPRTWRFEKKLAGSGTNGDINAHIVDMARFVTGQEITEISGAITETFIKQRPLPDAKGRKGKVDVDDAVLFLARFSGGAVGTFEAARQATGNQNRNGFEINGTKGSVRFNFERMNELEYYDAGVDRAVQGWSTIICTHAGSHPYAEAWWPDAHLIGYEHTFTNMAYDIVRVLNGQKPIIPLPDFEDAYQTQRVLEAVMISARRRCAVRLSEVQ